MTLPSRHAGCLVGIAAALCAGTLAHAHVIVDEPNGGESLTAGATFTIVWHVDIPHDTLNWDLAYSVTGPGGPWIPIAADLPPGDISDGAVHTFGWTVPAAMSTQVRVRVIQDNGAQDYQDISDGNVTIVGGGVVIVAADPPLDNPCLPGEQPFRIITAPPFPPGGTNSISVTFSALPSPVPSAGNIQVSCNGPTTYPCPTVTSVSGAGAGPYTLSLNNPIPPLRCTTFTFAGAVPGEGLQYERLPGDINMNGTTATADLVSLVLAINSGAASDPDAAPCFDINGNGTVSATDVVRLVGLLNGVNTTQSWVGAVLAACP